MFSCEHGLGEPWAGNRPGPPGPTHQADRRHSEESVVKWAPQESRLLTSSWDEDLLLSQSESVQNPPF